MERKLQLVYIHWSIMLLFVVATVVGVIILIRRRRDFSRAVPLWMTPVLFVYCLLAGLFFFNQEFFSHAMLVWPWYKFIRPMLRSLAIAVVPVACLCALPDRDPGEWKKRAPIRLAILPLLHSVTTIIYVFYSPSAIE
jgi:hypothetical protein